MAAKAKYVLFVHGIGEQKKGYSDPLWQTLWENTGAGNVQREEVFYYDVFEKLNAKTRIADLVSQLGLADVINGILKRPPGTGITEEGLRDVVENTLLHLFYYIFTEEARERIHDWFALAMTNIVDRARKQDPTGPKPEITILSHSLGTVVAYYGLHRLIRDNAVGIPGGIAVERLYSLASPLALIQSASTFIDNAIGLPPELAGKLAKPVDANYPGNNKPLYVQFWYSWRSVPDLVASAIPLTGQPPLDNADIDPYTFEAKHTAGHHDFGNYIIQARDHITHNLVGQP